MNIIVKNPFGLGINPEPNPLHQMKRYALFPRTPGLFSSLNVQKNMLQDERRSMKLKEAIFKTIKHGDVVIDLGSGTGILAIWAAQAGASHVFAIEETDVSETAASMIKANGWEQVITVIKANSSEVELPEKADVLIAELVGHFLFEEGIVEAIADIRDSLLKPDARIIPSAANVYIAPVQLSNDFSEITFWDTWKNPDLSSIRKRAANSAYVETVNGSDILATPAEIFKIDFKKAYPVPLFARHEFRCRKAGRLDAIAGWFDLALSEDVCLSTSPNDPSTHWQQCVFPLEHPLEVNPGESVICTIKLEPFAPGCKWEWEIGSGSNMALIEKHECKITYGLDSRLLKERF